jgi:ABC-type multidrug transport system permease subunit
MMIGGLILPTAMLPDAFARIGMLLPTTYSMYAFQGLTQNLFVRFDPLWSIVILLVGGILAFGLAIYLFCWDKHNTTRRGHPLLALLALLPYAIGALLPS